MQIYERFVSPLPKAGIILGWDRRVKQKFQGNPPEFVRAIPAGEMSQQEFYKSCDVIILSTTTFENLPRVGFEAMASGSILIVDNRGGWKQLVDDYETGYLCNSPPEFIYKASRLAFEKNERKDMRYAAREKLETEWTEQKSMDSWAEVFKQWEDIQEGISLKNMEK